MAQTELLTASEADLVVGQLVTLTPWFSCTPTNVYSKVTLDQYPGGSLRSGRFVVLGRGMWMVLFFARVPDIAVRDGSRPLPAPLKAVLLYCEKHVGWYVDVGIMHIVRVCDATEVLKMSSRNRE